VASKLNPYEKGSLKSSPSGTKTKQVEEAHLLPGNGEEHQDERGGHLLNQAGNVYDIRNSIKCGWSRISPQDLQDALDNECAEEKRNTVINFLKSSLKQKLKEVANG